MLVSIKCSLVVFDFSIFPFSSISLSFVVAHGTVSQIFDNTFVMVDWKSEAITAEAAAVATKTNCYCDFLFTLSCGEVKFNF